MRPTFLLFVLTAVANFAFSQSYKVTGTIRNAAREPVSLVSVQIKNLPGGTLSKNDGSYTLRLEEGTYDIVFSIVGYKQQIITLTVTKNYVQDVILEADMSELQNFTLRSKYKDPAVEIIRNVIRRKDSLVAEPGSWSTTMYIKAVQQDSTLARNKKPKTRQDSLFQANRDMYAMAMSEISLKLDFLTEQKIREERLGVKRFGSSQDLFYLSSTEGFF